MALAPPDRNVCATQPCIGEGAWDDGAMLVAPRRLVAETLGEADGVLIVDGSDVPTHGSASAGVARQDCGALGKVATCRTWAFLASASRRRYTQVDRRLDVPADWFTPAYAARRKRCGVPADLALGTAPQLAWEMIGTACTQGAVPVGRVIFDEGFGKDPALSWRTWNTPGCATWQRSRATRGCGGATPARNPQGEAGRDGRGSPRGSSMAPGTRSRWTKWPIACPRRPSGST